MSSSRVNLSVDTHLIEVIDSGKGKGLTEQPETEHGLGLLIVRRICQSYGWQFSLQNNPNGRGCTASLLRDYGKNLEVH